MNKTIKRFFISILIFILLPTNILLFTSCSNTNNYESNKTTITYPIKTIYWDDDDSQKLNKAYYLRYLSIKIQDTNDTSETNQIKIYEYNQSFLSRYYGSFHIGIKNGSSQYIGGAIMGASNDNNTKVINNFDLTKFGNSIKITIEMFLEDENNEVFTNTKSDIFYFTEENNEIKFKKSTSQDFNKVARIKININSYNFMVSFTMNKKIITT